ncbi:MAG TPA: SagB/ThcOx family dehydrogenase [Thermodesulfobacteriota bacterium]|nr:SagB/ThcOx family dehydrogenase [Thermodesulfobacteriota bacterium]
MNNHIVSKENTLDSTLRIKHGFNIFFDSSNNTVFLAPNKEVVIKGINEVIPKIIPLFKGGYTTREIISSLKEYSENSILELISVLKEHGILEESNLPPISKSFHDFSKWGRFRAPVLTDEELIKLTYRDKYKRYKKLEKVLLPKKLKRIKKSFTSIIKTRKSIRSYSGSPIDLNELSTILYLSRGVTGATPLTKEGLKSLNIASTNPIDESLKVYRNVIPSAGALYPIEVYLVIFNVNGIEEGLYHYYPIGHILEKIKVGDFQEILEECFVTKEMIQSSNLVFLMTAVFNRNQVKYGERGYRYILFEAGHIAQNVYLSSNALDIGAVALGGFNDDLLNSLLEIDGENESAIYAVVLGKD